MANSKRKTKNVKRVVKSKGESLEALLHRSVIKAVKAAVKDPYFFEDIVDEVLSDKAFQDRVDAMAHQALADLELEPEKFRQLILNRIGVK